MKIFLFVAAMLTGLNCLAEISLKVGDEIQSKSSITYAGIVEAGVSVEKILSIDPTSGDISSTLQYTDDKGVVTTSNETYPSSAIISIEEIQDIMTNCESYGGTYENLSINQTEIKTCKSAEEDYGSGHVGHSWYADIPTGLAKATIRADAENYLQEYAVLGFTRN